MPKKTKSNNDVAIYTVGGISTTLVLGEAAMHGPAPLAASMTGGALGAVGGKILARQIDPTGESDSWGISIFTFIGALLGSVTAHSKEDKDEGHHGDYAKVLPCATKSITKGTMYAASCLLNGDIGACHSLLSAPGEAYDCVTGDGPNPPSLYHIG